MGDGHLSILNYSWDLLISLCSGIILTMLRYQMRCIGLRFGQPRGIQKLILWTYTLSESQECALIFPWGGGVVQRARQQFSWSGDRSLRLHSIWQNLLYYSVLSFSSSVLLCFCSSEVSMTSLILTYKQLLLDIVKYNILEKQVAAWRPGIRLKATELSTCLVLSSLSLARCNIGSFQELHCP